MEGARVRALGQTSSLRSHSVDDGLELLGAAALHHELDHAAAVRVARVWDELRHELVSDEGALVERRALQHTLRANQRAWRVSSKE